MRLRCMCVWGELVCVCVSVCARRAAIPDDGRKKVPAYSSARSHGLLAGMALTCFRTPGTARIIQTSVM